MAEDRETEDRRPHSGGHETTDAQIKPIVGFLIILTMVIVAAFIITALLFNYLERIQASRDVAPSPLAERNVLPPEPRLQTTSRGELDELLRQADAKLNSYEWIDRESGVVRIPIERAMDLIVERGFPTPDPVPAPEQR